MQFMEIGGIRGLTVGSVIDVVGVVVACEPSVTVRIRETNEQVARRTGPCWLTWTLSCLQVCESLRDDCRYDNPVAHEGVQP